MTTNNNKAHVLDPSSVFISDSDVNIFSTIQVLFSLLHALNSAGLHTSLFYYKPIIKIFFLISSATTLDLNIENVYLQRTSIYSKRKNHLNFVGHKY